MFSQINIFLSVYQVSKIGHFTENLIFTETVSQTLIKGYTNVIRCCVAIQKTNIKIGKIKLWAGFRSLDRRVFILISFFHPKARVILVYSQFFFSQN